MTASNDDRLPLIYLYTPGRDFVRPYFERYMDGYDITDNADGADYAVMISSVDIYDAHDGLSYKELTPCHTDTPDAGAEKDFTDRCTEYGLKPIVLRCADIVGTGMGGFPRKMANKIYRGTYFNIVGNTAVRSFVHASSLPEAAKAVITQPGIYNVTDHSDTSLNEFADALAWRISQKRVFALGPKWFRLIFGRRNYEEANRSLTFSCEKLFSTGLYHPERVVDYLKNHVYDNASL